VTRVPASRLAAGLLVFTVAALSAGAGFGVAAGTLRDAFEFTPVLLAFAVVGWLVAARRPGNPIGWLFLTEALAFAVAVATASYARYATTVSPHLPAAAWIGWLGAIAGELFFVFPLVLLIFPDGKLPSARWRPLAWAIVVAEALLILIAAGSGAALRAQGSAVQAPVRLIPAGLANSVLQSLQTALVPVVLAAAIGCIWRYRRSSADERHQIKWFAYAGLVTASTLLIFGFASNNPLTGFIVFGPLVPIATGIAIMKYRLYDIDIVIRGTIVYAAMAAFITVVYVAIVAGLGSLASGSLAGPGSGPDLGLAILATAVVAIAFQPVRERAQRLASRLVYGRRASPYQALSEFAGRMGDSYANEDVLPRMARILAEGTGAERADVWLTDGSWLRMGACWPAGAERADRVRLRDDGGTPAVSDTERLALVSHDGEILGALSVSKRSGEALTPTEEKLLADLAAQAGLVLRNIGLTQQLIARLDELQASRQRIVAAQDTERRRIERDIHDGAQQHLLGIVSKLAQAESMAGRDEQLERELLGQLKAETKQALTTLRELAHGIYPPLLADQGLAAAIGALAMKAALPAELSADGVGRYAEEIETAVYFCCVEAIQNAVKHAPGSAVRLRLAEANGELSFSVADDGPGFDPSVRPPGSGLQNMSDRLAALGGALEISARPGSGTTIAGSISVAAGDAGGAGGMAAGTLGDPGRADSWPDMPRVAAGEQASR
jgi:signal transduction histidine kinase